MNSSVWPSAAVLHTLRFRSFPAIEYWPLWFVRPYLPSLHVLLLVVSTLARSSSSSTVGLDSSYVARSTFGKRYTCTGNFWLKNLLLTYYSCTVGCLLLRFLRLLLERSTTMRAVVNTGCITCHRAESICIAPIVSVIGSVMMSNSMLPWFFISG